MPYTKQSRVTPDNEFKPLYWKDAPSAGSPSPGFRVVNDYIGYQPMQNTESYRTGVPDDSLQVEKEPTTSLQFYHQVMEEKREAPSSEFDTGHPFFTDRCSWYCDVPADQVILARESGPYSGTAYRGILFPGNRGTRPVDLFPPPTRITHAETVEYGTRAISATTPTKSSASLSTLLGEVLLSAALTLPGATAISSIHGAKIARHADNDRKLDFDPRTLGSEYLNVQFGWKPMIGDLKKVLRSLKTASQQVSQYQRDSGKVVRRKFTFPDILTSSFTPNWQAGYEQLEDSTGTGFVYPLDKVKASRETVTRVTYSFSGAYSYYLQVDKNILESLKLYESLADKVLGSRMDPEALWELAPWSWLTDWFGTIGDTIANVDHFSQDGLVLRYGYLMKHTVSQNVYRVPSMETWNPVNGNNKFMPARRFVFRRETKERVRASPYGFAFTGADLSASQWAILGALGMTKGPTSLRGS